MKIVHFAPFAPHSCGLYEAARDMVRADMHSRHNVHFVDTGIIVDGKRKAGQIGAVDSRCDKKIVTANPSEALTADIIIAHTGIPDNWLVKCQAPIIWIIHGRPLACFRPEQNGGRESYTLTAGVAKWPRVKAMVTFWNHHVSFWDVIIPKDKLVSFGAPPIDERRFAPEGKVHDFGVFNGKYNIVIAESWREDVDIYEITHGALATAGVIDGLKCHFFAMETPLKCWNFLVDKMRELNIKGEICGRTSKIEEVYRAADILLSPQRITTRSIGEALSCGTPVIAANGNEHATWTADISDPLDVANTIKRAIHEIENNPNEVNRRISAARDAFSLAEYSKNMNELYRQVI